MVGGGSSCPSCPKSSQLWLCWRFGMEPGWHGEERSQGAGLRGGRPHYEHRLADKRWKYMNGWQTGWSNSPAPPPRCVVQLSREEKAGRRRRRRSCTRRATQVWGRRRSQTTINSRPHEKTKSQRKSVSGNAGLFHLLQGLWGRHGGPLEEEEELGLRQQSWLI